MTNSQLITNIKSICKTQNIPLSEMLEQCNLSKGFIYDVEKRDRTPSIDKITAIAEYFGVSVDYLLGRTDNPKVQTNNNNNSINNTNTTVNGTQSDSIDETTVQVAKAFQKLDFIEKAKVMSLIAELTEKNKTA